MARTKALERPYRRATIIYMDESIDKMVKTLVRKHNVFQYTSRNRIILLAIKAMYEKEMTRTKVTTNEVDKL